MVDGQEVNSGHLAAVDFAIRSFEEGDCTLAAILNRVPNDCLDDIKSATALRSKQVPVYAIPDDPLLAAP